MAIGASTLLCGALMRYDPTRKTSFGSCLEEDTIAHSLRFDNFLDEAQAKRPAQKKPLSHHETNFGFSLATVTRCYAITAFQLGPMPGDATKISILGYKTS